MGIRTRPTTISGSDLSLDISGRFLRHLATLLMDTGTIPQEITLSETERLVLSVPQSSDEVYLDRQYEGNDNFSYELEGAQSFDFQFFGRPTAGEPCYMKLNTEIIYHSSPDSGLRLPIIAILKISNEINLQEFFSEIRGGSLDLSQYLQIVGILPNGLDIFEMSEDFDPRRDDYNDFLETLPILPGMDIVTIMQEATQTINSTLLNFFQSNQDVVDFANDQDGLLSLLRLETLYLHTYRREDENGQPRSRAGEDGFSLQPFQGLSLNLYVEKLNPDGGLITSRQVAANPMREERANGSDDDIALRFEREWLHVTLLTFLRKFIEKSFVENEDKTEDEAIETLLAPLFPLTLSNELFGALTSENIDAEVGGIDLTVKNVTLNQRRKDGQQIWRLSVKLSADAAGLFDIADNNLNFDLIPIQREENGRQVTTFEIESNLRADFVSFFDIIDILPGPLTFLISLFLPKVRQIQDTLESIRTPLQNLPLHYSYRLPLVTKKWDPFFRTVHELFLEMMNFSMDDQLNYSSRVSLSRSFLPEEQVRLNRYNRDQGEYIYNNFDATDLNEDSEFYATHRLPLNRLSRTEIALPLAISPGSMAERIEEDKLRKHIDLTVFDFIKDSEEGHIDFYEMITTEEFKVVHRDVLDDTLDELVAQRSDQIEASVDFILSLVPDELAEDMRASVRRTFTRHVRRNIEDEDEFKFFSMSLAVLVAKDELQERDNDALLISPEELQQLIDYKAADFHGHVAVERLGHLYFRSIADKFLFNNILTLDQISDRDDFLEELLDEDAA